MSKHSLYSPVRTAHVAAIWACLLIWPLAAPAQTGGGHPVNYRVVSANQRLDMIVNTSRIVTLDRPIPRMLVNDTNILRATPLARNQVQVSALRPGVTQLNLWDDDETIYTVDVIVTPNARELEELLRSEFPDASIRVRPLSSSVLLTGHVPTPEMVGRVVRLAEDYYPQVVNNLAVGGVQQVLLHVQIMEVSRSKLRQFGVDWSHAGPSGHIVSSVSGLIDASSVAGGNAVNGTGTLQFGVLSNNSNFNGFIQALRENNVAKLLAEPTLTTVSGRPASFNVGGSFPIIVPQSLGTVSIEYREFGTRVDFLPIVLGNGNVRLEVRPQITERDDANGVNGVPAITSRWVDTAVEMQAGQTLALAGLISNRVEASNRGIPYLADVPWIGAAFRTVQHRANEVELLIMVRPEFCDALDPCQAPVCGPGMFSASPNDHELYCKGYVEVPHVGPGACARPGFGGPCDNGPIGVPPGGVYMHSQAVPYGAPHIEGGMSRRPGPSSNQGAWQQGTHNPHVAQRPQAQPSNLKRQGEADEPGLIGPLGYDLLNR